MSISYISVKEASKRANVNERTIRRALAEGKLQGKKEDLSWKVDLNSFNLYLNTLELFTTSPESTSFLDRAEKKLEGIESEEEKLTRELVRVSTELKRALKVVSNYEKALDDNDRIASTVISAFEKYPYSPIFRIAKNKTIKPIEDDPHEMLALISDAHYGETVTDLFGIEYNTNICERRMEHLAKKIIRFYELKSIEFPIQRITLAFLGDMLSGNIHDEIVESNEINVSEQLIRMAYLITDFVGSISEVVPEVVVPILYGNHPRLTKLPRHKNKHDNLEYIMGNMIQALLSERDNVEVIVPKDIIYIHEILGHRIGMTHGDGFKSNSFGGIPFYGLTKRQAAFQMALKSLRMPPVDMLAMGHFHQLLWWPGKGCDVVVNGSIKGPDEYAFNTMYAADEAQQALIFFNESHGVTSFERINLQNVV